MSNFSLPFHPQFLQSPWLAECEEEEEEEEGEGGSVCLLVFSLYSPDMDQIGLTSLSNDWNQT